ncbi:MAG: rhodanese-like domain-containing protein [Pseudomonadota bacterium]
MRLKDLIMPAIVLLAAPVAIADAPASIDDVVAAARDGISFVSDAYVIERQAENPDLLLYDVRTEQEFELGRLPGAVWMPRGKIEFDVAENVRDADAEIIIYCRTGSRGALATKALKSQGYRNVSTHEGFKSWADAGGLIETDFGVLRQVTRPAAER